MPKFSKSSTARLKTCHPLLQVIALEAIKEIDFVVVCGHRSVTEQQELFKQGRTKAGRIVTHIDGVKKKSKHNFSPSLAMDLAPYINGGIPWNNAKAFEDLSKVIMRIAKENATPLVWGGNFRKLVDMPHYELSAGVTK